MVDTVGPCRRPLISAVSTPVAKALPGTGEPPLRDVHARRFALSDGRSKVFKHVRRRIVSDGVNGRCWLWRNMSGCFVALRRTFNLCACHVNG
jgi:hypothetical protein